MQQHREGAFWKRLLNCFCPYYRTTVLNKAPSITFWFLSPTNDMIQKILQSCFEVHLPQELSLSVFQPVSNRHRHEVQESGISRDSYGKPLPGRQGGSSNDPSTPPASHNLTVGYLTTMGKATWKGSHTSCEARGTSSRVTKTLTWAAKVANKVVLCTKEVLGLFSPPLMSWALLLTLIHLITSITKLHCSRCNYAIK